MNTTKPTRLRFVAALAASIATVATGTALLVTAPAQAASTVAAQTQAVSDTLLPGQSLKANQKIVSKNGVYTLKMGADGNASLSRPGYPLSWSTNTLRRGSVLVMQKDGNLVVIYGRTRVWASGTDGSTNAKLVVQNDGNLVILNARGKKAWDKHSVIGTMVAPDAIRTDRTLYSHNRLFALQMRKDGNLVLVKGTTPLWSTKTAGHPGSYALIESDGNFGVLSAEKQDLWSAGPHRAGSVLQLTDAGKLNLVYGRTIVWTAR